MVLPYRYCTEKTNAPNLLPGRFFSFSLELLKLHKFEIIVESGRYYQLLLAE